MPHRIVRGRRTGIPWKTPSMSGPTGWVHGLGKLLMPALIDAAQACGMRQMIAVIGDSANQASISLHRRFGFQDAGLLERCRLQVRALARYGVHATQPCLGLRPVNANLFRMVFNFNKIVILRGCDFIDFHVKSSSFERNCHPACPGVPWDRSAA